MIVVSLISLTGLGIFFFTAIDEVKIVGTNLHGDRA